MNRITVLAVAALTLSPAAADEVRRPTIPSVMLGTRAETAEQCATKDKSIVSIESAKYADGSGTCAVRWVVETPSSRGTNYAVHSLCTSAKDQSENPNRQHYYSAERQRPSIDGKIVQRTENLPALSCRMMPAYSAAPVAKSCSS